MSRRSSSFLCLCLGLGLGAAMTLSSACKTSGSSVSGPVERSDLGPGDPGPGGIRFAASGEVLALTGYPFPPANEDAVSFVDGWEVHFSHLLVTVDNLTLWDSPDLVPADPSQTGPAVAHLSGPWALELARSDPNALEGKGGPGEQAVPFASIDQAGLSTDGTRYAFGFDAVRATTRAKMINVDGEAAALYAKMVSGGCTVLYSGTATFKGDKSDPVCFPPSRHDWPDSVPFELCFKSPTSYVNCQNPDNAPATPFPGEENLRGIALRADSSVVAQVTFHTDHPFWDSVLHDSPLHFDPFAARAVGRAPGSPPLELEALGGVDYTAFTDALGRPVDWRYCVEPPTDVHPKLVGAMRLDPQNVPHAPGADPAAGLRDAHDFVTYNQSTQGHLNSDGLCFVRRAYPSPP